MKNVEIKALQVNDLNEKIKAEKETLRKLKFSHAISPIENPMKIRQSRLLIARMETEFTNRNKK